MTYKVGQKLYRAYADDDTGKCEMTTWIVRSIRKNRLAATQLNEFTRVRNPEVFGGPRVWAKYIHSVWRESWHIVMTKPRLSHTKKAAWKECLHLQKEYPADDAAIQNRIIATLERMIKACP